MSAVPANDRSELPLCPICEGRMEVVYDRYHQIVAVCTDCHVSLTVPGSSWEVKRMKREGKWTPKP